MTGGAIGAASVAADAGSIVRLVTAASTSLVAFIFGRQLAASDVAAAAAALTNDAATGEGDGGGLNSKPSKWLQVKHMTA
jgi:hypothetical protein